MNLIEKLGGRKFLLTLIAFGTATAIELCTDRGVTQSYAMLIAGLVGVYGATNTLITSKAIQATGGGEEIETRPDAPPVDLSNLETGLAEVKDMVSSVQQNAAVTSQILQAATNRQAVKN